MIDPDELIEKQREVVDRMSFSLSHPDLLILPKPWKELEKEVSQLYWEYCDQKRDRENGNRHKVVKTTIRR